MNIIEKINRSTNFLDKSLEVTAVICLIISVVGAIIAVGLRYIFGLSYQIIEEVCRYTIVYGAFAFIGPLIKRNEHLKMDLLKELLKGKAKIATNLLINICLMLAFAFLSWSSIIWTQSLLSMNVMTSSGLMLMFIPTLAIPIGMLLGLLYSLLEVIKDLIGIFNKNITHTEGSSKDSQFL